MKKFEEIYSFYFTDIYKYILSISKNTAITEDVVQDTFYKAFLHIDSLKDNQKIKAWLLQIAKNTYLNYVSKNKLIISRDEIEIVSSINIELDFINKNAIKKVHKILHALKEPYKEVFYLRIFANLSFKEIADIFDKTEDWGRQTFHRSKIIVKEKMKNG